MTFPARFIILGGGCYGTFYAQQLVRAREANAVEFSEIVVVDHNETPPARYQLGDVSGIRYVRATWDAFFDEHLAQDSSADDLFVPSPFNPHLGLGWLMREIERQDAGRALTLEPFALMPGAPFRQQREHGTLVVSHADWICPVHCIEPEVCPKTRGPRDWDMDRTARALAQDLAGAGQPVDQVHLFHCHHVTYGVGAYPAAELLGAREDILRTLERTSLGHRFLIGTISRCHGAMHLLSERAGPNTVSQSVPSHLQGGSGSRGS